MRVQRLCGTSLKTAGWSILTKLSLQYKIKDGALKCDGRLEPSKRKPERIQFSKDLITNKAEGGFPCYLK